MHIKTQDQFNALEPGQRLKLQLIDCPGFVLKTIITFTHNGDDSRVGVPLLGAELPVDRNGLEVNRPTWLQWSNWGSCPELCTYILDAEGAEWLRDYWLLLETY